MGLIIATCEKVKLCHNGKKEWFVYDGVKMHGMEKHEAHLIFNDYLGQVMSGVKAEINLELRGK